MAKRLTDTRVKSIKAEAKTKRYSDSGGLYLNVTASGSKSWVQRVQVNRSRKDIGLGSYPSVSLAVARVRAAENNERISHGRDPVSSKAYKTTNSTRSKRVGPTFEEIALRFHKRTSESRWAENTAKNWLLKFNKHYAATLGPRPIDTLTYDDFARVIEPYYDSSFETYKRLIMIGRQVMEWAHRGAIIKDNPIAYYRKDARPKAQAVTNRKALHYSDVGDALRTMDDSTSYTTTKLAFRFIVLTAVRVSEGLQADWSEIDLDNAVWTVPADRTKGRKPHRVSLSSQAEDVLAQAMKITGGQGAIFPSMVKESNVYMQRNVMTVRLKNLGIAATMHGFRSSFRDYVQENVPASFKAMEYCLAHYSESNGAVAAYLRTDLLDQRRPIMQAWADYVSPSRL